MTDEARAKSLPTSGRLFGCNTESEGPLLFAVEAVDSLEASRRIAVIALMLGIEDRPQGTVEELDSDFDVSSVPTFYEGYFCDQELTGQAGTTAGMTVH